MDRYEGKPFLRLLELYALWAIGELRDGDAQTLRKMLPKLSEIYGGSGDWHEIVARVMEFPPGMASELRDEWQENKETASLHGQQVAPEHFAEMFADRASQ